MAKMASVSHEPMGVPTDRGRSNRTREFGGNTMTDEALLPLEEGTTGPEHDDAANPGGDASSGRVEAGNQTPNAAGTVHEPADPRNVPITGGDEARGDNTDTAHEHILRRKTTTTLTTYTTTNTDANTTTNPLANTQATNTPVTTDGGRTINHAEDENHNDTDKTIAIDKTHHGNDTPQTHWAKGTTYASTTNSHGTPPKNHVTTPLDDTMAKAVQTLQIAGHHRNSSPTRTPTTPAPWTTVTNSQKKAPKASTTSQEFGLAFERTTKGNNWSTDDLLLVLQTIQAHDPKAMISSADNKTKPTLVTVILHKAQKDIPWFTKFTAMKTMTWGKPSDGTTKIVFSFWLTSTIIKKDLAQLRMDSDFTEMLKGTNTYMKVTKLLEPHSKIVGYFLGKDIIHTNRDDITNRLAAHITQYSQTIWKPALDVLNTTVLGKGHNTRMVTLVVGNTDYQGVLDILMQQPMETLSFLDHRTKRQDINQFDKMLKYHDYIVSHSTAVRLENVNSLDTQALWAHLQPITNTSYCDISDGRTQGTTYIQCFKEKEPEVATAIQSYLLANFSDSADRPIIGERGGGTVNSSSTGTRTYRGNHSGKSTGKATTATLNQTSQKAFAAFLKNCPTIDIPTTLPTKLTRGNNRPPVTGWSPTARSYKDILAGTPPGDNSPNSSITMQSQKTEPTGNKSSNRSRKSLESENVELRNQLNHMQQAQTAMQDTQTNLLDTQNKLLAQIATMSAALQDLMQQQGLAPGNTTPITSPPRKLSKHTRNKASRTTAPAKTPPATTPPSAIPTSDIDSLMADTGSESGATTIPPTANLPTVSHPGGCRAE